MPPPASKAVWHPPGPEVALPAPRAQLPAVARPARQLSPALAAPRDAAPGGPLPLGQLEHGWVLELGKGSPTFPAHSPYTSPSAPTQCCPPSSPEPPVFPASRLGSRQPTGFFSWVFWCFSPFREIVCCSTFSAACRSIRAYAEQEIKHWKSSSCEGSASPPV